MGKVAPPYSPAPVGAQGRYRVLLGSSPISAKMGWVNCFEHMPDWADFREFLVPKIRGGPPARSGMRSARGLHIQWCNESGNAYTRPRGFGRGADHAAAPALLCRSTLRPANKPANTCHKNQRETAPKDDHQDEPSR